MKLGVYLLLFVFLLFQSKMNVCHGRIIAADTFSLILDEYVFTWKNLKLNESSQNDKTLSVLNYQDSIHRHEISRSYEKLVIWKKGNFKKQKDLDGFIEQYEEDYRNSGELLYKNVFNEKGGAFRIQNFRNFPSNVDDCMKLQKALVVIFQKAAGVEIAYMNENLTNKSSISTIRAKVSSWNTKIENFMRSNYTKVCLSTGIYVGKGFKDATIALGFFLVITVAAVIVLIVIVSRKINCKCSANNDEEKQNANDGILNEFQ